MCSAGVHQIRNHYKRSGVSVYIHKNMKFKIRNYLSINSKDIESVSAELLYEKRKNSLFNAVYKSPDGKIEPFEDFLKIKKAKTPIKIIILQEISILINLLDHDRNKKVQDFSEFNI